MIIEENEMKEEKNETLLVDLCEYYFLLNSVFSSELIPICVSHILKEALNKGLKEEAQKEVEMFLLALSCISQFFFIEQKLYLNEIKDIIQYHQEHHNMTHLSYQSAWQFLIRRILYDRSLEEVVVNELHFAREASRELEWLIQCVDWKRTKEERGGKIEKEEIILLRWFKTLEIYFRSCLSKNEEFAMLVGCIVQIYREAKDNCRDIRIECIESNVKVDDLLKGGAINAVSEEIQRSLFNDEMALKCTSFFMFALRKLKEKGNDEIEEEERNATKMKMFEKMEEEGYEDCIIGTLILSRKKGIIT
ncbi:uncharacterized protein MONOS_3284 [Monocercomonoides exilis]|uniref:uncharacterized protein n=1 Tax=Monocercomonoides exilis TaxID=2049356 RepID=UPI0035593BFA|nr:hypothetical protein MONOS_3284 [Monocercomonoides exilis]|eukprot:MONOS_3284.1-p1 / transcript=MONOS_3284.1 / gene=MONOS_3284 / organism=Monocercomonoides_exilis_PA203 / gene_product=unspecified product / transcript_product=unspecified product / location=Mono_scaffold00076:39525-40663(+) / protein_length=306 / sequence_SO=supercontig / SO=protein_coding / is_pseudo=false